MSSSNETAVLLCGLATTFNDGENWDFVVKVGEVEFKVCLSLLLLLFNCSVQVYKHVLGWHSEFFRGMFDSGMREANEGRVVLKEHEPPIVEHALRYCYTCKLPNMQSEILIEVYEAAHFFQMPALVVSSMHSSALFHFLLIGALQVPWH